MVTLPLDPIIVPVILVNLTLAKNTSAPSVSPSAIVVTEKLPVPPDTLKDPDVAV
jgi:hypothetical protein